MKSFFVFRSTTPQDGYDTNAILSRAEFHLSRGDFKSCLQELDLLEESTADLFSEWKKKLKDLIEETN